MSKDLKETVFDLEADGLLDTITKIHCVCWRDATDKGTLTTYPEMRNFFTQEGRTFIGHNILAYDLRALFLVIGIAPIGPVVDTLPLSWYLDLNTSDGKERKRFGLEEYGVEFGVPKPKIDNWTDLTLEEYVHRCSEDVEINWKLWLKLKRKLQELYDK